MLKNYIYINHDIFGKRLVAIHEKKAISCFNDKRHILFDGISMDIKIFQKLNSNYQVIINIRVIL